MSEETALWRAVVVQAIVDATTRSWRSASMPKNIALDRQRAREWLLTDRRDFPRVCEMADLDPAAVREAMQLIALDGWRKPLSLAA